jgi:hypothetical protein
LRRRTTSLKHVVAELTLDNRALKELLSRNWGGQWEGGAASYVTGENGMSERHACRLMGMAPSTRRYRMRQTGRKREVAATAAGTAASGLGDRLARLTAMAPREGTPVSHKTVYRPYGDHRLSMQVRHRRRLRGRGHAVAAAERRNRRCRWSLSAIGLRPVE